MTDEEILDTLRSALAFAQPRIAKLADQIGLDTAFADLGVESLALLEMAAFVEHKLNVTFPNEDMMGITGVRQFVDLIRAQQALR